METLIRIKDLWYDVENFTNNNPYTEMNGYIEEAS